jgi:shikimate dehydrogenase
VSALGRVGLIGDPVAHSLSPAFQQAAFDALGLDVRYELWPTPTAEVPARLDMLRSGAALGANVTVPHKETVFAALGHVSEVARRVSAVNTLVVRDRQLYGDNTDVAGFTAPLLERGFALAGARAVVLGAGGAARGVVVALLDAGVEAIVIANRTSDRAEAIAATLGDERVRVAPLADSSTAAHGATLLVNATALGWATADAPCDSETFAALAPGALAYDLTYRETAFLRAAAAAGVATLDGLSMLVEQGARSFELWTGQTAPRELMWRAAVVARAARGA